MADFPILSQPTPGTLNQTVNTSGDLKHSDDAGYQITRRRFTRTTKKFTATYALLTDADEVLMQTFIDSVTTVAPFFWTHPTTATVHEVRFIKVPVLSISQLHWGLTCEMEEI